MSGTHKFQIRLSHKDFFKEDLTLVNRRYRSVPEPTDTLNTDVYYLLSGVLQGLRREAKCRIFTPSIHGSKGAMLKRLVRTVEYWLQAYSDTSPWTHVNCRDTRYDTYGNTIKVIMLDFNDKRFTVPHEAVDKQVDGRYAPPNKTGDTYTASGRVVVEVVPVLRSSMKTGFFKRFLARFFQSQMRTSKNKFETTFDVKLRFWVDPHRRFETTVYSLKVSDNIIMSRDRDVEEEHYHNVDDLRKLERLFRSKGSVRIRRIR